MPRRAARRSSPGLLLVEATITAAVLGVSLVLITRSFSTGLRALDQARRTEAALGFAQRRLRELELDAEAARRFHGPQEGVGGQDPEPMPSAQAGTRYRFEWRIAVESYAAAHPLLNPPLADPPAVDRLSLTVSETSRRHPVRVTLSTLVPRDWVPDAWTRGGG